MSHKFQIVCRNSSQVVFTITNIVDRNARLAITLKIYFSEEEERERERERGGKERKEETGT